MARARSGASSRRLLGALFAGVAFAGAVALASPSAPAAAAEANVTFQGHGFGHGRGMGQWGALGYATNFGWGYRQILDHFYGATAPAGIGSQFVTVRLMANNGLEMIVYQPNAQMSVQGAPAPQAAVRIALTGSNTFVIFDGPGCAGPWTARPGSVTGPVTVSPTAANTTSDLLQLCGSSRSYRGNLQAVDAGGSEATVNVANMEQYLYGVVPRESPASWGSLSNGMEALKAQAVAARSYAWSENRWPFAKTCDTTSCQVYGGAALNGQSIEDSRSNTAVEATAGEVRVFSDGSVARTEFSSSTGGYTAGGTFPPVPDDGDAVSGNPNHNWSRSYTLSDLSARLGVGSVTGMSVTQRNGYGADGGRALTVAVQTSGGTVYLSGATVQARLGLLSDWFTPFNIGPADTGPPPAGGYRVDANGVLSPFGSAGAASVSGVATSTARAVAVGGPSRAMGTVLTGDGLLHPFNGGASGAGGPQFPFDAARDVVLRGDGTSGYVLDLYGAMHPFGGAPVAASSLYDPSGDLARRAVLRPDGVSGYFVMRDGRIGRFGNAPAIAASVPLPAGRSAVSIWLEPDGASVAVVDDGGGVTRSDGTMLWGTGPAGSVRSGAGRLDGSGYLASSDGGLISRFGAPSISANAMPSAVDLALSPELAGYTLDLYGGLHPFGGAPLVYSDGYWPGWDIARAAAVGPSGRGWTLDGFGGIHGFGPAGVGGPVLAGSSPRAYWPGWDIARDIALLPGRDDAGYTLDGWGGLHPFGGAPPVFGGGYWPGWDIARAIALLPNGTGYTLDGWGGIHPFAPEGQPMPPQPVTDGYWPGWDIARGIVAYGPGVGAVLDGFGGVHAFGIAPSTGGSFYWPGNDVARGLTADPASRWTAYTDTVGGLHTFNATPLGDSSAVFPFNAVRDATVIPGPLPG